MNSPVDHTFNVFNMSTGASIALGAPDLNWAVEVAEFFRAHDKQSRVEIWGNGPAYAVYSERGGLLRYQNRGADDPSDIIAGWRAKGAKG